jgi:hypothetical protein
MPRSPRGTASVKPLDGGRWPDASAWRPLFTHAVAKSPPEPWDPERGGDNMLLNAYRPDQTVLRPSG